MVEWDFDFAMAQLKKEAKKYGMVSREMEAIRKACMIKLADKSMEAAFLDALDNVLANR